jgi:tetratricopeptide (TPR) repeat protein
MYKLIKQGNLLNYKEAEEYYLKVLEIDPNKKSILFRLLELNYYKLRNYDEAKKYCNKMLELSPNDEELLILMGNINNSLENYEGASGSYYMVLDLDFYNKEVREKISKLKVMDELVRYYREYIDIKEEYDYLIKNGMLKEDGFGEKYIKAEISNLY